MKIKKHIKFYKNWAIDETTKGSIKISLNLSNYESITKKFASIEKAENFIDEYEKEVQS